MTQSEQLGWWYQCSGASQFRCLSVQQVQLAVFDRVVKPAQKALAVQFTDAQHGLARFIKGMFEAHVSAVWSVPAALLALAGAPWSCNIIDLYARTLALAKDAVAPGFRLLDEDVGKSLLLPGARCLSRVEALCSPEPPR